jgi:hypothetical protein
MTPVVAICMLLFLVVWILGVGWQVGYFPFLNRRLGFTRGRLHLSAPDEREGTGTGVEARAFEPGKEAPEHFERRSMIEKSRRLLLHGLVLGFAGLLAMAILFIATTHFRKGYILLGMLFVMPALIWTHMRWNVRHLWKIILTTPCPRCGKLPMNYSSRSKDERRLLICTQCRTEWDLGPAGL